MGAIFGSTSAVEHTGVTLAVQGSEIVLIRGADKSLSYNDNSCAVYLDTVGAIGSIPVAPTIFLAMLSAQAFVDCAMCRYGGCPSRDARVTA